MCLSVHSRGARMHRQTQSCPPPVGRWRLRQIQFIMKKQRIEFRISTLEKEILKKKAEHSGLSISEYCRRSALMQKINYKLTADEIEIYKLLVNYRNGFTSIRNLFTQKQPISEEIRKLIAEIDNHLSKLK